MKRSRVKAIPVHDYGNAVKSAVSWLGDRYVLAEPVTRRVEEPDRYYGVPRSWHETLRRMARA